MTGSTQHHQEQDSKPPQQLRSPLSLPSIRSDRSASANPPAISIGTAVAAATSLVFPPSITVASPLSTTSNTFNALDLPPSPHPSSSLPSFSSFTSPSLNSVPPHSVQNSSSSSANMATTIATASVKSSTTSTTLSPLPSPTVSLYPRSEHSGMGASRPTFEDHQFHHTSRNASSNGHGYDSASTSQRSSHETGPDSGLCDDDFGAHISFVYANNKRFSDFHSVFRSVPDDEKLIEDYGCALQKEILVQGRLYISENHVCFNANIFGWVTNLVIAFSEITAIEKRMTAFVIPNAIGIVTTTNTKGHFFASFLSRDAAHDLLMAAWRKSFPCAANATVANGRVNGNGSAYYRHNHSNLSINDDDDSNDGQSFIAGKGDSRKNRHRRSFSNASQTWPDEESGVGEEIDERNGSSLRRRGSRKGVVKKLLKDVITKSPEEEQRNGSLSPNIINNKRSGRVRSVSELPPRPTSFDGAGNRDSIGSARPSFENNNLTVTTQRPRAGTESLHIPGTGNPPSSSPANSASRAPTSCTCSKDGRHYPNNFMSETYPGSVQAMWKLMFDSDFSKSFLTSESMKGADVQEEAWQNSSDGKPTKTTRYTKWLGMPIGPKTTKAILTDVCENKNFDDYTTTVTTTSTPDVPSGGSFTTKVRTCITWAGPNQVQVVVTGAVEFTKSSWIKGQIEKGAAEGMGLHYKELNKCIRKHIAANPKIFGGSGGSGASSSSKANTVVPATAQAIRDHAKERLQNSSATSSPSNGDVAKGQDFAPTSNIVKTTGSTGSSPLAGIVSTLSKSIDWSHSTMTLQLAFVAVLVVVMVANFYIFLQISSVSTQIEKIQSDILGDHYQHHRHHQSNNQFTSSRPSPAGSGRHSSAPPPRAKVHLRDIDDFEREELFAQAQEEAMWAWLTEREARHRQYRSSSGVHFEHNDRYGRAPAEKKHEHGQRGQQNQGLTATEANMQLRIDELQEQLAALERQASMIKVETRVAEKDVSTP